MGWSQSYKQGSEEGRGEWARAGRQRPRWRGRERLESGVSGPERPLLLFQKAPALGLFLFTLEVSFFIEAFSYLLWPIPRPRLRLQTGPDSKNLGSWGSFPNLRFRRPST